MSIEWFPSVIAIGKAFCNREHERKLLKTYILHGRHTVLIAPRRYGKTSLINQVLLETKLPHCVIELTMAINAKAVEEIVLKQIGELLHSILPRAIQAKQAILNLFKFLNPELVLTVGGQKLIFHPEHAKQSSADMIAESLKKLDEAAIIVKKRVVVVMDEFQQLNEIKNHSIEASIRHAMQYSKKTSYIFAGSHRHMLLSMFNSKNRPFYNSCEMLLIDRIGEMYYRPFIQNAAIETWGKQLSEEALSKIFSIAKCHPNYVNRLCSYFWLTHEFPTPIGLESYWANFVMSKHSEFTEELLNLSANQRKMLSYLAHHPTLHPSSQEVCHDVALSEASIRQAVNQLLLKDYLFKDESGVIKVLDPALHYFISNA